MDSKKLVAAITRLVKIQVDKEMDTLRKVIRLEIMSEVAGMLNYSERKLLMRLDESTPNRTAPKARESAPAVGDKSEFARAINNMKSMPSYKGVENVRVPVEPPRKISGNPLLDEILNETEGFTGDEVYSPGSSLSEMIGVGSGESSRHEPWTDIPDDFESNDFSTEARAPQSPQMPQTVTGIDGRPVDLTNPTVQNVMNILSNTNFKEKFDRISEAGNNFRGMEPAAPKFKSEYFEQTKVD